MDFGEALPDVRHPVPNEVGHAWVERLAASECPALTTRRKRREERTGASHDPIVWVKARGANVLDADGNRYVDMTSGFGVAFIGHGHPAVVEAVRAQAGTLMHALGDLHPSTVKIELLERLCRLSPWEDARAMLSLSGADAITAALKTAMMATGKAGVLSFDGSYHGLSYGPLAVSGYSERFAAPFVEQLGARAHFARWPRTDEETPGALASLPDDLSRFGALIFEPIQGRGGVRFPPTGFLEAVVKRARAHGLVVIADEVLTGLGRCGSWWRSVDAGLMPDLICVGKALGGGLPVSACLGSEAVMRAWGAPDQEAIHTGTFFGDPLGAAAALASLDVIDDENLLARAKESGDALALAVQQASPAGVTEVRHEGMMVGLQLSHPLDGLRITRALLERGYLVLPAGAEADVVQLTPPVCLTDAQRDGFVAALSSAAGAGA